LSVYASPVDLIDRFDERDVQELVLDDESESSLVDIRTNLRVKANLDDAEGEVVAALRRGGRYSATELAGLSGTDQSYLKRIICEIAMLHLLRRRPTFRPQMLEAYEKVREYHLKTLQSGDSIITSAPEDLEAGLIGVDGPSVSEWNQSNLWRDRTNYFPKRIERFGRNN
jgi:phage gp36-like protein